MTPDDHQPRQGYLLLADISGYTAFLTGTELEHSHEIIRELAALIRERLAPPMRFVKREGDAVFCYADARTFEELGRREWRASSVRLPNGVLPTTYACVLQPADAQ